MTVTHSKRRPLLIEAETLKGWCRRVGVSVGLARAHLAGHETALAPWVRKELERRRPEEGEKWA